MIDYLWDLFIGICIVVSIIQCLIPMTQEEGKEFDRACQEEDRFW